MKEVPESVHRLAAQREHARRAKDFAGADDLRNRIRELGYEVTDNPEGAKVSPRVERSLAPPFVARRSDQVESRLEEAPRFDASVQWVVEGWPQDILRGIESFGMFSQGHSIHPVVADLTRAQVEWPAEVEVVHVAPQSGWALARNAALRRAAGRVVIIVDGSVEPRGDVLSPLLSALEDPSVGITGPFGIVTDDLREFREADGPDVDAIEGYVMAFRRELVEQGLRFDERFKFYRNADIELSFQVKAMGLRATVTPLDVVRHDHRMWTNTPETELARLSKRNFSRFLDTWRARSDLLVERGDR
jgi:cysteinyl-tRNA synthetase